jgi:hypothetical protein
VTGCSPDRTPDAPAPHVYVGRDIVRSAGKLSSEPTLSNGCLRLRLTTTADQRAGISADVRGSDGWLPATSEYYGDWTFIDSSVTTAPTEIALLSVTPDEVAVRWTFGNHRTGASPDRLRPYPFTKTVWLRRGEYGYYTWIRPVQALPGDSQYAVGMSEHEVGFGGLWGPATIRTGQGQVRSDRLKASREFTDVGRPDAAEFRRDGDPVVRILVPIPPARLLVPRFSESSFGGIFVHHLEPGPYGAYLYAAPRNVSLSRIHVMEMAWREAPAQMVNDTTRSRLTAP